MSTVHMMDSTDDEHPCTSCGFTASSQVRGGPDPRLKCGRCNFVFSVADSKAAKAAGAIPDGVAELQPETPKADRSVREKKEDPRTTQSRHAEWDPEEKKIPRSPSFVVISKDRTFSQFATKKTLKQVVLNWEALGKKFDCFELTPRNVSAKIDIS